MTNRWTGAVKRMRTLAAGERADAFRMFITKECGSPLTVREARKQLFLLTAGALAGRPRLMAVGDDQVVLMSLADLEAILLDLSFARFVESLKRLPRKKVQNR
ncbi:hypothetical protein [Rhizobium sp. 11515TR]|uniref:hypothetical protein n=1 Tax=Rhizobium sp. 11515TR TaxID=2028343 RepID=UPI000BA865CC|nr:hypothetical protein [Rhizobium sp. 11515TR]ASW06411.1 hypothetical protein CKA34_11275 [Rhizobium sp. 11515TR]